MSRVTIQYELQFPEYKFKVGDYVTFDMRFWDTGQDAHRSATYQGIIIRRKFYDDRSWDVRKKFLESNDPYDAEVLYDMNTGWRYIILVNDEWTTNINEDRIRLAEGGVSWEI